MSKDIAATAGTAHKACLAIFNQVDKTGQVVKYLMYVEVNNYNNDIPFKSFYIEINNLLFCFKRIT